jgi:hypothetical protein
MIRLHGRFTRAMIFLSLHELRRPTVCLIELTVYAFIFKLGAGGVRAQRGFIFSL